MRLFVSICLFLLSANTAIAQSLPCGTTTSRSYRIRWHPLPSIGQGLSEFVLTRQPNGGEGQSISLPVPALVDGVHTAIVDGFADNVSWTISLVARGPGGDSAPSNSLTIPALVSGAACSSSGPPTSPVLLDVAEKVEADAFLLREQALRLEEQAQRLRGLANQ